MIFAGVACRNVNLGLVGEVMMRAAVLTFLLATLAVSPAGAFQKFEEYRIRGDEIASVKIGPMENEAPATMVITLKPDSAGGDAVTIESDDDLEACKAAIEGVIGDAGSYVQIRAQLSAETMNGVMVTECVVLQP
ncbi:MAG: hypothetical protein KDJ73_15440 [Notoacmeibacter sp.]|nr:hypothetical protein [Notoacmeibacter sp.]